MVFAFEKKPAETKSRSIAPGPGRRDDFTALFLVDFDFCFVETAAVGAVALFLDLDFVFVPVFAFFFGLRLGEGDAAPPSSR